MEMKKRCKAISGHLCNEVGRAFEVGIAFFADCCQQWPMMKVGISSESGINVLTEPLRRQKKALP
jgi:hypothetical protein